MESSKDSAGLLIPQSSVKTFSPCRLTRWLKFYKDINILSLIQNQCNWQSFFLLRLFLYTVTNKVDWREMVILLTLSATFRWRLKLALIVQFYLKSRKDVQEISGVNNLSNNLFLWKSLTSVLMTWVSLSFNFCPL